MSRIMAFASGPNGVWRGADTYFSGVIAWATPNTDSEGQQREQQNCIRPERRRDHPRCNPARSGPSGAVTACAAAFGDRKLPRVPTVEPTAIGLHDVSPSRFIVP